MLNKDPASAYNVLVTKNIMVNKTKTGPYSLGMCIMVKKKDVIDNSY